ncbi:MAG: GTP-binding protein [Promethearchaeota archaeon]
METTTYKGKCVIIGDSAVGKTSLISCFVEQKFPNDYLPTIGTNLYLKEVRPSDDVLFQLTCWDIAGEKKWNVMRKLYYKGSTGAFIVADLSRPETFNSVKDYWIKELREYCSDIPVVLLANKADLDHSYSDAQIEEFGKEIGVVKTYITSAKTSFNVDDAFITLVRKMVS